LIEDKSQSEGPESKGSSKLNYRLPLIWFACLIVVVFIAKNQLPKDFFNFAVNESKKESTENRHSEKTAEKKTFFPITLSELKEKTASNNKVITVLNLWATWCEPCKEEIPWLLEIQKKNQEKINLLLVSMDPKSQLSKAKFFLDSIGVDFTTYFKTEKDEVIIEGLSKNWSGTLPATFIFDSKGSLLDQNIGEIKEADLKSLISQHL
jgi:thiol-disulfide isomerase/thioredoxin